MGLTNAALTVLVPAVAGTSIPTPWNGSNTRIGVGDSSTAFAITQTDLVAATNKFRQLVTGSPTVGGLPAYTLTYVALFATTDANYTWAEWATFNAASSGLMLQRFVQALGTKTSAQSWQLTVTLTFVPS